MFKFDVKTQADANQWKGEAQQLNEEAKVAVEEARAVLNELGNAAEGSLIDEIIDMGTTEFTALTSIMQGMQGLCDVLDKFTDLVKNEVENGIERLKQTVDRLV